jgi:muramoyltetrapeptide carboxypeptidase
LIYWILLRSKKSKWIVGFSDVTVLQSFEYNGLQIHSRNHANNRSSNSQAIETLRIALFGEKLSYEIDPF